MSTKHVLLSEFVALCLSVAAAVAVFRAQAAEPNREWRLSVETNGVAVVSVVVGGELFAASRLWFNPTTDITAERIIPFV